MEKNIDQQFSTFYNNQCVEDVVNMIDEKKSIKDVYIIDGKLIIVFNEELQINELDDIQTILKKVRGCDKVFNKEFELQYQGKYKSIIIKLLTEDITVADFTKSEFVSMYNKPIGETIFYVYDIDDEYFEEEDDDIFDIENWDIYEFKNIHDAIAKHEDSNLQDIEPIRYTTWFDTNEPPFVYEWGVVTSDGKMKAQTREGRDLPTYAHGGKIDMEELEYKLKRIKKENPGKKVGYSFIADAPKGYRISINGKYRDEQGNYHAKGGVLKNYPNIHDLKMIYKFEGMWYAWGEKNGEEVKGEGKTKKQALEDLDLHLSYITPNENNAYSRHMETRKRMRNDENTYPKGFNEFAKGGNVEKSPLKDNIKAIKKGDRIKDGYGIEAVITFADGEKVEAQYPSGAIFTYRQKDFDNGFVRFLWADRNIYANGGEVNKKNSIEWLFNQMGNQAAGYETEMNTKESLDYAKQMHKKEIIDAWKNGNTELTENAANNFAEKYYNQEFLGIQSDYYQHAKGGQVSKSQTNDIKFWFKYISNMKLLEELMKFEEVLSDSERCETLDYTYTAEQRKVGIQPLLNFESKLYDYIEDLRKAHDEFHYVGYKFNAQKPPNLKRFKNVLGKLKILFDKMSYYFSVEVSFIQTSKKYNLEEEYNHLQSRISDKLWSIESYEELTKEIKGRKYAQGGEVKKISATSQVKRNLRGSGAFTLELEMAVYVPSTTTADQIIPKTLFQKRIQEVEKYVSKLFGGYSSTSVEGGYVSKEKGLIKEDVAKVTAFGTEQSIKKNFKPLMRQISKWCEAWGQESMGFEFEGDLYYVSKDAKFSKGGKIENKPVKPKFVKNARK